MLRIRTVASVARTSRMVPVKHQPLACLSTSVCRREELEGIVKGLYHGKVLSEKVFPYPVNPGAEEQEMLESMLEPINRFYDEQVDSAKIDRDSQIPKETLDGLKELGLFGIQIPEKYGGLGQNNSSFARIVENIASDGGVAVTLMAHQSIGLKGILMFGTEEQKEKYLPRLASGENTAAFALTEPGSGSDAASIKTRATLSDDGKAYLLNGSKCWISNGGTAEIMTVFARTTIKDPKTGDEKDKVTAFIVERSFGGLTSGKPEDKLGIRGSNTTEVFFEDCRVPLENVLGEVGSGFKVAVKILNSGRFGLGAGAAGSSKKLLAMSVAHVKQRTQFGRPLADFGLIRAKLTEMAVSAYALESAAFLTTSMIDSGKHGDCALEAAMCKIAGSEALWINVNEALQMAGGQGFIKTLPYERFLRDARILQIFEGTNEILRMFVSLMGVQSVGKSIKAAAKNPMANMGTLGSTFLRTLGVAGKASVEGVHPSLKAHGDLLATYTAHLNAAVTRALMDHKNGVVEQQQLLRRIADISIDLFLLTATVSRTSRALDLGVPTAEHDSNLCAAFARSAETRLARNVQELREGPDRNGDAMVNRIAEEVLANDGYFSTHPLDQKKN